MWPTPVGWQVKYVNVTGRILFHYAHLISAWYEPLNPMGEASHQNQVDFHSRSVARLELERVHLMIFLQRLQYSCPENHLSISSFATTCAGSYSQELISIIANSIRPSSPSNPNVSLDQRSSLRCTPVLITSLQLRFKFGI